MFSSYAAAQAAVGDAGFVGAKALLEKLVYKTAAGTPSVDAAFLGQRYFDSTNSDWYTAVDVGQGASDWKQDSA